MFKFPEPKKVIYKARHGSNSVLDKLESYINGNAAGFIHILAQLWQDQQDVITYQELRDAIITGEITALLWKAWSSDYSNLVKNKLRFQWEDSIKAGAESQPFISDRDYTFNHQRPGVMRWITERGAEFVTVSTNEQIKALRSLIAKNALENHTVDETARQIRPCIGLNRPQAIANRRYYDNIKRTLTEEHPRMKRESIERKAREAAAKYAEKQHRYRAMMIARTEMAFAYNWGADEAVRQAQDRGLIGGVVKRWCTAGGDRVCKTCEELDGTRVGIDLKFSSDAKAVFAEHHMLPPLHPNCMCAIEYIESESLPEIRVDIRQKNSERTYTKEEVYEIARQTDKIVSKHLPSIKSKWSGNVKICDETEAHSRSKDWNCDIWTYVNTLDKKS